MASDTKEACQPDASRWNATVGVADGDWCHHMASCRGLETPCLVDVAVSADDAVGDEGGLDGALAFDTAGGFKGGDAVGLGHRWNVERLLDKDLR